MDLNKLIIELKEKAAKATPDAIETISICGTNAVGKAIWALQGAPCFEKQAKLDVEYYNLLSPDVVIPLCEALEEARETLEFIAGRQSFRDLDETEKARAFLTKYFLKDTGKPIA